MGAVRFICRSKETQSLKRSFHNASDEDDSSALGPLAGKGETELRKLVTEKPDLYEVCAYSASPGFCYFCVRNGLQTALLFPSLILSINCWPYKFSLREVGK